MALTRFDCSFLARVNTTIFAVSNEQAAEICKQFAEEPFGDYSVKINKAVTPQIKKVDNG